MRGGRFATGFAALVVTALAMVWFLKERAGQWCRDAKTACNQATFVEPGYLAAVGLLGVLALLGIVVIGNALLAWSKPRGQDR